MCQGLCTEKGSVRIGCVLQVVEVRVITIVKHISLSSVGSTGFPGQLVALVLVQYSYLAPPHSVINVLRYHNI